MVHQVSQRVKIPVIGCGGICKVEDVASTNICWRGRPRVMLGYIIFRNPSSLIAIIDELGEWCEKRGFKHAADLTEAMNRNRSDRRDLLSRGPRPVGQGHKTFVPGE